MKMKRIAALAGMLTLILVAAFFVSTVMANS